MKKFLKSLVIGAGLVILASTALAGSNYSSYGSNSTMAKKSYYGSKQSNYQTVVDAAIASPNLSTLVTALKKAGLVSALQKGGPFIVFAPTNKAFNRLPTSKLNSLLQPQNRSKLQAVLKYHVVQADFKTLQGKKLYVSINRVNRAHVIKTVKTGNGIVYVIDRVLIPA